MVALAENGVPYFILSCILICIMYTPFHVLVYYYHLYHI